VPRYRSADKASFGPTVPMMVECVPCSALPVGLATSCQRCPSPGRCESGATRSCTPAKRAWSARSSHQQHPLAKALVESGKVLRTLHALRWFTDEAFRRRIGRQLNRGKALNDLRRFIFFAHRGAVRYPHHDDQVTQAHCHTLVVNACIFSTTCYLQDAIDAHRAKGHEVSDAAIAHLSPAHFEAINPYGALSFDVASVLKRSRRPLRSV
jgi:hypothetical protein